MESKKNDPTLALFEKAVKGEKLEDDFIIKEAIVILEDRRGIATKNLQAAEGQKSEGYCKGRLDGYKDSLRILKEVSGIQDNTNIIAKIADEKGEKR